MHPIEEIRNNYDHGRPLPGVAYRDSDVFAAEAETLFRDSWISVACGQNVAEPGDLFPVRIAGYALLVVRDDEGEVRVFYNLCRHRGAPLADVKGSARAAGRIVCPYHSWSYGLDGRLVGAPHFHRDGSSELPSAEECEGLGLLPVRTALWRDVVFVNLSGEAPPFEDFIRPLDERMAPWTASELRPLSSDEYEIQANWKLVTENFIDAYHLPVVHPQMGGGFAGLLAIEDIDLSDDIVGLGLPHFYREGSGDADSPLPRFSGLAPEARQRVDVFSVFPNTLILVEPDNQQVIVLRPQGPGVTHETFANYLVADAFETDALAKARDEVYREAIEINDQDAALLAGLQATRSMDVGAETRLTQAWDGANGRFQRLWARKFLASLAR
ncbi:MAG: aromatic ring-hydroxylating dioxygenase subunit alpha [Myxococcota bacterium]|nr:aromatic ring-hydroxylating dioxygenase subunit alpha [Myxococcota bacterium]